MYGDEGIGLATVPYLEVGVVPDVVGEDGEHLVQQCGLLEHHLLDLQVLLCVRVFWAQFEKQFVCLWTCDCFWVAVMKEPGIYI